VIFVVVPFIINVGLAFIMITKENLDAEFSEWLKNNTKVLAIFTLFAGADVEILNILESKILGFECFNAKFSKVA